MEKNENQSIDRFGETNNSSKIEELEMENNQLKNDFF